jgi:hypothetical protein
VELSRLELGHLPRSVEMLLLFRGPRFLFRMIGRGRLRRWASRAAKAYERRIAVPLHRRVLMPIYYRVWPRKRQQLIERHVLTGVPIDLLVVCDPLSIPEGAALVGRCTAHDRTPTPVVFGLDYATPDVRDALIAG